MLITRDLTRRVREWLAHRPTQEVGEWTILETVAGLTACGDAIVAHVVEPRRENVDPSVLLETWGVDRCLEAREIHPVASGDGRFVVFAVYASIRLDQIDHWRVGAPGGVAVLAKPPSVDNFTMARFVRVLNREILVPGNPRRLTTRGMEVLHHDDCYLLRRSYLSLEIRPTDLQTTLAMGVKICRACMPLPPLQRPTGEADRPPT